MDISHLPQRLQLLVNQSRVDAAVCRREVQEYRELNYKQAARIMELEMLLSCLRRVGDGVHVDHQRLMSVYRFMDDQKGRGYLSQSKFARK